MGGRRYTRDELKLLKGQYTSAPSVAALARQLDRSPEAVKQKALELGLHRPREIPPESPRGELMKTIVKRYADAPSVPGLAKELGITPGSLKGYAYRLGVKRSREVMKPGRAKGGRTSVAVRRAKAVERKTGVRPPPIKAGHTRHVFATPLDAAWRGLINQ